ncbi:DUF1707 domain-containing protein [Rhodococcus sp. KRD175]|uniref:DUF1707 SHOCT-like domain-containing protein n=1 Tax=Rhodococcus sp. KRD175 TaxID=2729729 RepID=UPI0019CFA280|nr:MULTISPECIES: DUF1707 domain-containing protein [unclassified Rhodococcus (in: high G+C Gram-positive bacteria)]MBJ7324271.1 DUF1707 domain-containing protein [Rhodococcus sp. (in: high G+C Gram-positive bacteria)]
MTPTEHDRSDAAAGTAEKVPTRASNVDRERVSMQLHDAATAGMLTMTEVEERLGTLYAARYVHELNPLLADLPTEQPSARRVERVESVREGIRATVFAAAALVLALLTLAKRHRVITAALAVLSFAVLAALVVFAGFDIGDQHELGGVRELGEH